MSQGVFGNRLLAAPPIFIGNEFPTGEEGQIAFRHSDNRFYRFKNGAWVSVWDSAITADQISAGSITASQINVDSITAGSAFPSAPPRFTVSPQVSPQAEPAMPTHDPTLRVRRRMNFDE